MHTLEPLPAGDKAAAYAELARSLRALLEGEPDARFLAALAAGLPPCAGVALGFDRVVMVAAAASAIDEVIAFPVERA